MSRQTKIIIAVIILAVVAWLGFVWQNSQRLQSETIEVGAILPLTGPTASTYGDWGRRGIDLAVEEINLAGGINGKQLKIIYEDSQGQGRVGVEAAQKLIQVDRVPAIIGDIVSGVTLSFAPIAEEAGVVVLAPGSATPNLTDAGDYIFRIKVSATDEAPILADFVLDHGHSSIAVLHNTDAYGTDVGSILEKSFEEKGGRVVTLEEFEVGAKDVRTQLSRIRSTSPDAVVVIAFPREVGIILKQAQEQNLNLPFFAHSGSIGPETVEVAGQAADGLVFLGEFDVNSERAATQQFAESYEARFGFEPELFSALGYDAARLTAMMLERCGGSSDCIRDELYQVEDYEGVSAVLSFNEKGDVVKPFVPMVVRNGEFVPAE